MIVRLLLFLFLCPTLATAGLLEGRVVHEGEPVAGLRVGIWSGLDFSGEPQRLTLVTAADGSFSLDLPAGDYALFIRDDQRQLFAFCGRNPVNVPAKGKVWAGLQVVRVAPQQSGAYDDDYSAGIEGVVLENGRPLAGALVSLYLDTAEGLKGQGYRISSPTAADGFFIFDDLPESSYFLVARKRAGGGRVGPVQAGDRYGVYPGNPVLARAGRLLTLQLPVVTKLKSAVEAETPILNARAVVRGLVQDPAGKPLPGLHVFAYTDRVIGHKRPAALSPPTGDDGLFELQLPAAGTYYIGARQHYGDSPAPGELFGMYDKTADHGLKVEAGAMVEQIRIEAEPIDLFGN